jgi:hypothetical protein
MVALRDVNKLVRDFTDYLHEMLGVSVLPQRRQVSHDVPLYLSEAYAFYQMTLLGIPCVLMVSRSEQDVIPETIWKQMVQVRKAWDGEVIYVVSALSRYARKALIKHHIPFVVPGNQLYLPPLGVDLRERFHVIQAKSLQISPATQSVLLSVLCFGTVESQTPTVLASKLGYSPMTMSRAFDELEATEFVTVERHGKERMLRFHSDKQLLWQKARDMMRNPVRKRVLCRRPVSDWTAVQAGLTALAHYTMLAAPDLPVYAMSAAEWRRRLPDLQAVERAQADCEVELWSYSPGLFAKEHVADPFSLYLSLRHYSDERIDQALRQMMEHVI